MGYWVAAFEKLWQLSLRAFGQKMDVYYLRRLLIANKYLGFLFRMLMLTVQAESVVMG